MKNIIPLFLFLACSVLAAQDCNYGQCGAITSKGTQCKRCVSSGEYYCSSHDGGYKIETGTRGDDTRSDCQYGQCIAETKDGDRCRRCTGSSYSNYCGTHRP